MHLQCHYYHKAEVVEFQFHVNESIFSTRVVKLAALAAFQCGPRDDSEISNEFRQYCNGSSSNKRLKPRSETTLGRYKFLSFGDKFTDAGKVMTFFLLGNQFYFGLHYRDRCPEKW